jgi:hypothetical protein
VVKFWAWAAVMAAAPAISATMSFFIFGILYLV